LGKSAVKRPLQKTGSDGRIMLKEVVKGKGWDGVNCISLVLEGLFEHGNELPVSIHFSEFLNSLSNY